MLIKVYALVHEGFSLLPLTFVQLFQYLNERFEIVAVYVMAFAMVMGLKAIVMLVGVSVMLVEVIIK
jgi:hypothetical protein